VRERVCVHVRVRERESEYGKHGIVRTRANCRGAGAFVKMCNMYGGSARHVSWQ